MCSRAAPRAAMAHALAWLMVLQAASVLKRPSLALLTPFFPDAGRLP